MKSASTDQFAHSCEVFVNLRRGERLRCNCTRMATDEQSLLEKQIPLPALVEGLLFVADEPVTVVRLAQALEVNEDAVEAALNEISADGVNRGVRLQRKGDRVQLVTRPEAAAYIERFMGLENSGRLSQAALETLSIVAYRQPCTRAQIEVVRGVNCDSVLRNLLSKGLIEESGRLETVGHPFLYSTTFAFLQHFGLRSLNELPPLEPTQTPTLVEPDTVTAGASDAKVLPTELDVRRQEVNDAIGIIYQSHPQVAVERAIDRRVAGRRSARIPNHRVVGFLVDDGIHLAQLQDRGCEPGRRGIARGKKVIGASTRAPV